MPILNSNALYSSGIPQGNENGLYAVTKNKDNKSWDVKNRTNNTIISTGDTIESAINQAVTSGIDATQIYSQPAFYLNTAPIPVEDIDAFNNAVNLASSSLTTSRSKSDLDTAQKYQNSNLVSLTNTTDDQLGNDTTNRSGFSLQRRISVPFGAEKQISQRTAVSVTDRKGNKLDKDLRVKLRIPPKYFTNLTEPLGIFEGIIFPYTPSIQYEFRADYGNVNPVHTNFPVNFYQRSSLGPISITGKFSVQNEADARIYIATMVMLRAITRMRFGGARSGDPDSGAPPPVCRLSGHGSAMLDNVPVVVTNYRVEYPDSVDYFTVNNSGQSGSGENDLTSVPVVSTIAITCLPMYSREEMQQFSVNKYLSGEFKGKGFI